jgi:hypothetical protein
VRFDYEQVIGAPFAGVMEAFADPAFYEALSAMPDLGRPHLLSHREEGGLVHLQVQFSFTGNVSPAVRRVVNPDKLTWVLETTVDPASGTVAFTVVPDHYPDRLTGSGTHQLSAEGDRTRRVSRGDLRVHFPLVGPTAERAIVRGFERHLDAEAELLEEWLVA